MLQNIVSILAFSIPILLGTYFSWVKIFPSCHTAFKSPVTYTATKSPYLVNTDTLPVQTIADDCSAQQIWMLIRHGTRTPNSELIKKFQTTLQELRDEIVVKQGQGRGSLCDSEFQLLKAWLPVLDSSTSQEKMLMPQGVKEMAGIASRYQTKFPHLFSKQYKNESFYFKYTQTERTKDSADAFTAALFGETGSKEVQYPESLKADPVLRFYKACPKWGKEVNKNPETYKEQNLFAESTPFQNTLKAVSERLGYETTISKEQIILMYQACAFETSFTPERPSPWCFVFSENDFQVLEYYQDLDYYWVDGYGHEITYQSACPAVMDMLSRFENHIHDDKAAGKVTAYFTHSGTTLKFLARLGLFQEEEHLRSDNFHSKINRKWRTSRIGAFASNIAVVLYKCRDVFEVGMLFQEVPVSIPFCNDRLRCPYTEFRNKAKEIVGDQCDNEKICQLTKSEL